MQKAQMAIFSAAILVLSVVVVSAQTKTVTNADLAKFAEKRVQAERDYRENYERLGMPSPEELEKQNAAEAVEREELSRRLRAERLQKEAIKGQREAAEYLRRPSATYYIQDNDRSFYQSYPYFYGGGYSFGQRPIRRLYDPIFNQFRGNRNSSFYPWIIIRTPTVTPNFGGFPRRH